MPIYPYIRPLFTTFFQKSRPMDKLLEIYIKFVGKAKNDLNVNLNGVINFFGVTQDPQTREFMLVIDFVQDGNLHQFLLNYNEFNSRSKLSILKDIAEQLSQIHKQQIIHRDFHSGNILINKVRDNWVTVNINDFGISLYGIIPYIAPEVLRGGKLTIASDVYSFGMIMWEITSGQRPFSDRSHDVHLINDICDGIRPPVINGTSKPYIDLMMKCWETDPSKRPAADMVAKTIREMTWDGKTELPNIKGTKIAVHPDAVFK
ncbi:9110_t:CDS:2, partial [Racocetra fulgida]